MDEIPALLYLFGYHVYFQKINKLQADSWSTSSISCVKAVIYYFLLGTYTWVCMYLKALLWEPKNKIFFCRRKRVVKQLCNKDFSSLFFFKLRKIMHKDVFFKGNFFLNYYLLVCICIKELFFTPNVSGNLMHFCIAYIRNWAV